MRTRSTILLAAALLGSGIFVSRASAETAPLIPVPSADPGQAALAAIPATPACLAALDATVPAPPAAAPDCVGEWLAVVGTGLAAVATYVGGWGLIAKFFDAQNTYSDAIRAGRAAIAAAKARNIASLLAFTGQLAKFGGFASFVAAIYRLKRCLDAAGAPGGPVVAH
ncbi:MAG: hypothetical protein D6701_15580 [Gemmatimonadetes bacterium]|nr:MAG: hypothetical protein D6701_15580 [Gemmatimonadota bacterium]